jgi:hypothetical protein
LAPEGSDGKGSFPNIALAKKYHDRAGREAGGKSSAPTQRYFVHFGGRSGM